MATVQSEEGGVTSRFIKENWPIEEGLILGTTKLDGRQVNLTPEEGSNVLQRERVLI